MKTLVHFSAIFALILLIVSCSENVTNNQILSQNELYKNAVNDAMTADESEISNNLIAITDSNTYIKRKNVNGKNYVLALTFTPYSQSYTLNDTISTYWGETWVTIVPEMTDYFKKFSYQNDSILQLRISQLLGMPEDKRNYHLVEIWVDPDSLFRPAPDNEITDNHADLFFPANATESYKLWFNNNILHSYFPSDTTSQLYPWTRLGYTYNWAEGEPERGLSEFILKKNSKVIVNFNGSPNEYIYNK